MLSAVNAPHQHMAAHLTGLLAFATTILHCSCKRSADAALRSLRLIERDTACTLWGMVIAVRMPPQHVAAHLTGLLAFSNLMILKRRFWTQHESCAAFFASD